MDNKALIKEMFDYAFSKPGATHSYKPEWHWDSFHVGDKLFFVIVVLDEDRPGVNVKLKPEHGEFLRQQYEGKIVPGYYMNKTHWNTIYLDNQWEKEFLFALIDEAYDIGFGSLSKKKQKEISETVE